MYFETGLPCLASFGGANPSLVSILPFNDDTEGALLWCLLLGGLLRWEDQFRGRAAPNMGKVLNPSRVSV